MFKLFPSAFTAQEWFCFPTSQPIIEESGSSSSIDIPVEVYPVTNGTAIIVNAGVQLAHCSIFCSDRLWIVSHLSICSHLEIAKHIKSTKKTGIIWEGKLKHFYQPEWFLYLRIVGIYQSLINKSVRREIKQNIILWWLNLSLVFT